MVQQILESVRKMAKVNIDIYKPYVVKYVRRASNGNWLIPKMYLRTVAKHIQEIYGVKERVEDYPKHRLCQLGQVLGWYDFNHKAFMLITCKTQKEVDEFIEKYDPNEELAFSLLIDFHHLFSFYKSFEHITAKRTYEIFMEYYLQTGLGRKAIRSYDWKTPFDKMVWVYKDETNGKFTFCLTKKKADKAVKENKNLVFDRYEYWQREKFYEKNCWAKIG